MAKTDPAAAPVETTSVPAPEPVMFSEGMRADLEIFGACNDPLNGDRLVLDREAGEIVRTSKKTGAETRTPFVQH